jgi:hypothetical protein
MATVHATRLCRRAGALSRTPQGRGAAQAEGAEASGEARSSDFIRTPAEWRIGSPIIEAHRAASRNCEIPQLRRQTHTRLKHQIRRQRICVVKGDGRGKTAPLPERQGDMSGGTAITPNPREELSPQGRDPAEHLGEAGAPGVMPEHSARGNYALSPVQTGRPRVNRLNSSIRL